jgi:hypothetical protein
MFSSEDDTCPSDANVVIGINRKINTIVIITIGFI